MSEHPSCYHCGDECADKSIHIEEKYFCCEGCKTVCQILDDNGLCTYYDLENNPGLKLKPGKSQNRFAYLDDAEIRSKLIVYEDEEMARVQFYIPQIHCASCLFLLENLYKLHDKVLNSVVEFTRKEVTLDFQPDMHLSELVSLLASIGYEPELNLGDITHSKQKDPNRKLYYQLGIAGFAFGNIMLFSFPDYLGFVDSVELSLSKLFGYLSIALALPVVFYSSQDYFKSAFAGLKQRYLNIDVPVSLGVTVLFVWSVYEIVSGTGAGYLDSLAGLVFFLLIGRWYQNHSFQHISFERDYTSYFPISVTQLAEGEERAIPLTRLQPGDKIIIHSNEIVPADAILESGEARLDYSFVTGESAPVKVQPGSTIYAGARQTGGSITLQVRKAVSQSYLTQLWTHQSFKSDTDQGLTSMVNRVSRFFTPVILLIAAITFIYWSFIDLSFAIKTTVAVLIVACPCALALAVPFAYGNAVRLLGNIGIYLRSSQVIERMANITTVVFDKTGTITHGSTEGVEYRGGNLSEHEKQLVAAVVKHSLHPLSKAIKKQLGAAGKFSVAGFEELDGKGITANVDGTPVRLGSASWLQVPDSMKKPKGTAVWVEIGSELKGCFVFAHSYRNGLQATIARLGKVFKLALISGDNADEKTALGEVFSAETELRFSQSPMDKLEYVNDLQQQHEQVMMIGDGLNDAGALKQSDVGVAITEDVSSFSPACDVVMDAERFTGLPQLMNYSKTVKRIVFGAFFISFLYNTIGMAIAVQGLLSPVIAAILMPASSVTVVIYTLATTWFLARRKGLFPGRVTKVTDPYDVGHNAGKQGKVALLTNKEVA